MRRRREQRNRRFRAIVKTEVLPRIRFAEGLAARSALDLDGLTKDDALVAISQTLAIVEQWVERS